MNTKQAKQIDLCNFLSRLGISPIKVRSNNAWYLSPLRQEEENEASFKIDTNQQYWFDFGLGKGGTIIDFVSELKQTNNISDILKFIEQNTNWSEQNIENREKSIFSFHQQKSIKNDFIEQSNIRITQIKKIENQALIDYLKSRHIFHNYQYLQEAHWQCNEKEYFALAFKNDEEGYEIRNKYFKGCTSKALTKIINNPKQPVYVFEGFMDYLSLLEIVERSEQKAIIQELKQSNFIILNSVSLVEPAIKSLQSYDDIRLFFDNDDAGASSSQKIKNAFPFAKDYSNLYQGFKDLNEFLVANENICFDNFLSRCVFVGTESPKDNLAFTPEVRKRDDEENKKQFHPRRKRR